MENREQVVRYFIGNEVKVHGNIVQPMDIMQFIEELEELFNKHGVLDITRSRNPLAEIYPYKLGYDGGDMSKFRLSGLEISLKGDQDT